MGKFGRRYNRYAAIGGSGLILATVSAKNKEIAKLEIAVKEKDRQDWLEGGAVIEMFPLSTIRYPEAAYSPMP